MPRSREGSGTIADWLSLAVTESSSSSSRASGWPTLCRWRHTASPDRSLRRLPFRQLVRATVCAPLQVPLLKASFRFAICTFSGGWNVASQHCIWGEWNSASKIHSHHRRTKLVSMLENEEYIAKCNRTVKLAFCKSQGTHLHFANRKTCCCVKARRFGLAGTFAGCEK